MSVASIFSRKYIARRFTDYQVQALRQHLFPTSVLMFPSFTVMHHARGQGDMHDGADISYQLNMYGIWQPNNIMGFKPDLLESFLEGLAVPGVAGERHSLHILLLVSF